MAVYETHSRTYVCDRCAETEARDGTQLAPANWCNVNTVSVLSNSGSEVLLCPDCVLWLRRFLEGRKVTS